MENLAINFYPRYICHKYIQYIAAVMARGYRDNVNWYENNVTTRLKRAVSKNP